MVVAVLVFCFQLLLVGCDKLAIAAAAAVVVVSEALGCYFRCGLIAVVLSSGVTDIGFLVMLLMSFRC